MAKRQLRARETAEEAAYTLASEQLTPEQMAAYIRQSTTKQTTNNLESALLQQSGAQRYAVSQGLDFDKIIIAHEGNGTRGVSGTLRIDQRERLQEIMAGILAGTIKLVWAYSVSRLFRDKYGVQVGTFIEACAKNNVKVVVETAQTFDFRDTTSVMFFQILANVAAKENEDRSRLMHDANRNKAKRGEYHGRPLNPGFIIDRDKASKTFGKYIEYTPHAEVAKQLYARLRVLNGQFNILAREVASMPYVFPAFESWVDQRDINRLLLKRVCKLHGQKCDCELENCELVGYQMSRVSLLNLLTAVEYAGYWKTDGELLLDESGAPKKNHDAIIPLDNWQYAFNKLSFCKLDGSDNTARPKRKDTWAQSRERKEPVLLGLLTAPNGNVQYTSGVFRIMEKRPGKMERSGTLVVKADMVDKLFLVRIQDRYLETGQHTYDRLFEELTAVKANNAKALVSVDEQIAGYEKSIEGKQAVMAALGTGIDVPTAKRYNAEIKEDRANLNALREKRNAAAVEEAQLTELCEKIDCVLGSALSDDADCEIIRRFIKLATDKIELQECSAHFATLTVTWSIPFAQTDVCYLYLPDGVHENWTERDLTDLRELYPESDRAVLLQRYPTRSWIGIMAIANDRGIKRINTSRSNSSLPTNLSLKDKEIIDLLGFNPRDGYVYADMWVNDVVATSS